MASEPAPRLLKEMVTEMNDEWIRRSNAGRATHPAARVLTDHDKAILLGIHRYDGILSIDQIQRWFGYGTLRNARRRMNHLYHHKYVHRWKGVYWLDKRGAEIVAEMIATGLPFKEFRWRDEPFESNVPHDVLLNEFRHTCEVAAASHPLISVDEWYGRYECLALFPQRTEYLDQFGVRRQRHVRPDGLAVFRFKRAKTRLMRFCVEFDNATESNVRFARDKVYPGIQFAHSAQFQDVLHTKVPARWLTVATGPALRYKHLRTEVAEAGGAHFFLFTQAERVTLESVLTSKIWQLAHRDELFSLDEYETDEFQASLHESTKHVSTPALL